MRPGCVRSIAGDGIGSRCGTAFDRLDRRFVFAPDVPALDTQSAVGVDADERAGTGDFGGIEGDRPLVECRQKAICFGTSSPMMSDRYATATTTMPIAAGLA